MVRTKADGASGSSGSRKAVGGNAPRKALGGASTSSACASPGGSGSNKYGGGNAYCPRPTPDWQKGMDMFLSPGKKGKENTEPDTDDVEIVGTSDNCQPGSSGSSSQSSASSSSSDDGQGTSQDD